MKKSDEILQTNSCFNKAHDDELMFVLLGRDKAAPYAIRSWCNERVRLGLNFENDAQIIKAFELAKRIEESHSEDGKKVAGHITMHRVESNQIFSIGHCPDTNTLAIQFKSTKGDGASTYHYGNVTAEQFEEFRSAESIGKYFGTNFKNETEKHPFTKVAA
jgi:hypothetical protein